MTTHALNAAGLGDVSKTLQALHQQLLRFQADQVGFMGSPLQLFDRATRDSSFAWLKPLREAIVSLDERRAESDPISTEELEVFETRFRNLLDGDAGPFREKFKAAFQSHPETIWSVRDARNSVGALSKNAR